MPTEPQNRTAESFWRKFRDVDSSGDADALTGFLDSVRAVGPMHAAKSRSLKHLGLRPGDRVLDIGCGTGEEVRELSTIVGPSGRAVGLDRSEALIAAARERSSGDPGVEFFVGDVHRLPFSTASFDACRADRTLQHLHEPDLALAEMRRVVRPGGRVAVSEVMAFLDAPTLDSAQTARVIGTRFAANDGRGWIGYLLPMMFKLAALTDIAMESDTHVLRDRSSLQRLVDADWAASRSVEARAMTQAQATAWLDSYNRSIDRGETAVKLTPITVVGTRA